MWAEQTLNLECQPNSGQTHLRYCTFYCSPLSNRQLVIEIMDWVGVDELELADRLDVDVDVVRHWTDGEVRPRFSDLDEICRVCEFDVPPGFGANSKQLEEQEDTGLGLCGEPDSDSKGYDREDMASAGWMSIGWREWEVGVAGPRGNATKRFVAY